MELASINLDDLYKGLEGLVRPPLQKPDEVEQEPIVLVAVREACYWIAKGLGWEFKGELPEGVNKGVILVAPHTTMLDFVFGMATYRVFKDLKGHYLAKKELFRGPFRYIFEKTGGVPVDRSKKNNLVKEVAKYFEGKDNFFLALAPEGTRKYTTKWKSGFYRIALEANVPIVCGYLDFDKKEAGIGDIIYPSGDFKADAKKIEAFYKNVGAFWPKKWNWRVTD